MSIYTDDSLWEGSHASALIFLLKKGHRFSLLNASNRKTTTMMKKKKNKKRITLRLSFTSTILLNSKAHIPARILTKKGEKNQTIEYMQIECNFEQKSSWYWPRPSLSFLWSQEINSKMWYSKRLNDSNSFITKVYTLVENDDIKSGTCILIVGMLFSRMLYMD